MFCVDGAVETEGGVQVELRSVDPGPGAQWSPARDGDLTCRPE